MYSICSRQALSRAAKVATVVALSVAVLGASGCHWFRKKEDLYAKGESERPLEFPPAFNQAEAERNIALSSAGSVSRSSLTGTGASSRAFGFNVETDRATVFAKIGEVLAATPGLTIASRAQALGAYDVDYEGKKFLVRVSDTGSGSNVAAVDPRGVPADSDAASKLIVALKAALNGK